MSILAGSPTFRAQFFVAYIAICLIWGSTFLAIRFALGSFPPFLMAGVRFAIAGTILFAIAKLQGADNPLRTHWKSAVITGFLLFLVFNGGLVLAVGRIHSSIVAVLSTTIPVWMVMIEWLRPQGTRPNAGLLAGLVLGLLGITILVQPWNYLHSANGASTTDALGVIFSILAMLGWALGSVLARSLPLPASPFMTTAIQMWMGSTMLTGVGLAMGEWARLDLSRATSASLLALLFLIVFGSVIAYSAYMWLLRNAPPTLVSTYTYINPLVAITLGSILADEPVTHFLLLALVCILGGIYCIARFRPAPPAPARK
ncbi:MAG: multidrug transporter [Candidatus Kapaibacterium sp.]|nr:MAG: multidrug transporter [Candidatus Kapabacteria bacterium]